VETTPDLPGFVGIGRYIYAYVIDEIYRWKTKKPLRTNWAGIDTPLQVRIIIDDLNVTRQKSETQNRSMDSKLSNTVLNHNQTFEIMSHLWDHIETYDSNESIRANF